MLFAGDHVMQGSTVVINPPDGNMKTYLASLEALLFLDVAVIAPGHGYLIGSPHREIRKLLTHRLSRESKILEAVANHPETAAIDLVPIVYAETSPRLHPAAARSLLAHLAKLVEEGHVTESQGRYALRR